VHIFSRHIRPAASGWSLARGIAIKASLLSAVAASVVLVNPARQTEQILTTPPAKPHVVPQTHSKPASAPAEPTTAYRSRAPQPVNYVPTAYHSSSPQAKTALIIGIGSAPGADPLPGSITDAKTVRTALLDYGFPSQNITMLLDSQATRGAILNALDALAARSSSSGVAVVSITTHSSNSGSENSMRAWDGRVYAHELGSRLGRVRGRLVTFLPTCYSGGYAVPGVVGANRIAVFSSPASEKSWQLGEAGSWMILYMVKYGMINGGAPTSVESAFGYAKHRLEKEAPDRVPHMSDGISGDMKLGPVTWLKPKAPAKTAAPKTASTGTTSPKPAPQPTPTPTATPSNGGLVGGLFGH
jgi:hypothetical protein